MAISSWIRRQFRDNVTTAAVIPAGLTNSALSFTVNTGFGASFPDGSIGPFIVTLDQGTAVEEKALIQTRVGDNFTVAAAGRGYNTTTAQVHSANCTVLHTIDAQDLDEANQVAVQTLGAVTASGDLLQGSGPNTLARLARGTSGQFLQAGASTVGWVTATAAMIANAADKSSGLTQTFGAGVTATGNLTATGAIQAALTGTSGRYIGDTNGSPAGGPYLAGDFANDFNNITIWICTVAGSPGTWAAVSPSGAWTSFSSTWDSNGGTTPTIGNGSIISSYIQQGKLVNCRIQLTAGSTTTFGTQGLRLSLPVNALVPTGTSQALYGTLYDGTNDYVACGIIFPGSFGKANMYTSKGGTSGSLVTYTSGVNTSANDRFHMVGCYEAN